MNNRGVKIPLCPPLKKRGRLKCPGNVEKKDAYPMSENILEKMAFCLYDLAWKIAIPWLRKNQRLADGFGQRTLRREVPGRADLWIQAASAGESYLAQAFLRKLMRPARPIRVLMTTNTRQGMDILKKTATDIAANRDDLDIRTAYFPFDQPSLMAKAVHRIHPRVMVFLELEMWPGLLSALRKYGSKVLVINGRITAKSLKGYLFWPSVWQSLAPDQILAISPDDADRFATLFGKHRVTVMRNIKFDRISEGEADEKNPLSEMIPLDRPFLVLGSTRQEEEPAIENMILHILQQQPGTLIGLFPRHMHRIAYWETALKRMETPWMLRSELRGSVRESFSNGGVLLWDTFGELSLAYASAKAVFVGGSLAQLGGQNFLEPLICGVIPVIGPSWENFAWVGADMVEQGLVRVASDWKAAADILAAHLKKPQPKQVVHEAALRYVRERQGGTEQACRVVADLFDA